MVYRNVPYVLAMYSFAITSDSAWIATLQSWLELSSAVDIVMKPLPSA